MGSVNREMRNLLIEPGLKSLPNARAIDSPCPRKDAKTHRYPWPNHATLGSAPNLAKPHPSPHDFAATLSSQTFLLRELEQTEHSPELADTWKAV